MKTIFTLKNILFLAVIVTLSACQSIIPLSVKAAPAPLSGEHASIAGASALLMTQNNGMGNYFLTPISAATGKPVAGLQTVDLGLNVQYAFSPNREILAYTTNGNPGCSSYCLNLFNVRTWKEVIKPIVLTPDEYSWVESTAFTRDGNLVALTLSPQLSTNGEILLVDIDKATVIARARLDFNALQTGFTPDGSLAVYGSSDPLPDKSVIGHVAILDGSTLKVKWAKDLPMVSYGNDIIEDPSNPNIGRFLDPAVAFTADTSRLYLVTSDVPKLITIDLQQKTISSTDIQPHMSLLERLMATGTSVVYAKMLNGTIKYGLLSNDGNAFYIVGQTSQGYKDSSGNWNSQATGLGLQVVNVHNGTEVARLASDATDLSQSPDGKTFFLISWKDAVGLESQPWTDVVQTNPIQISSHMKGEVRPTRLLDGSLAWLSTNPMPDGSTQLAIYNSENQAPPVEWQSPPKIYVQWIPIP